MNFFRTILDSKYKVDKNFKSSFESWQKNLLNMSIYISIITIIVEIIVLFFYIFTNTLDDSINDYIFKFILRPGIINVFFIILGKILSKHKNITDEDKIAIPILLFIIIFSNIIITHYVFPILYIILIVPIYLSTIYANNLIELKTFIFSIIGMIVSFILIEFDIYSIKPEKYYYNVGISFLILIVSHFIAKAIIKNETLKEDILKNNYKINSLLLEDLYKDGFTKLYNHTALFNLLDYYINNNYDKDRFHIAVIDVDNFKKINDTYGHEAGNVVLIEISNRLIKMMNTNSNIFVARYGGDEICVVFYDFDKNDVINLLENFRVNILDNKFKELNNNNITVSIGIASYHNENSSDFFGKADKMLYEAKKQGRNKVVSD